MVHRLERDGLLRLDERREVRLTERGLEAASSIVRRHRLAERMLVDLLGYEWWKTHEEAERIEHAMSEEFDAREVVQESIKRYDQVFREKGLELSVEIPDHRLSILSDRAKVERIPDQFEHEPGFLEYLDTQGVRPGVTLEMIEHRPGTLRVAVDGDIRSLRPDCGQKVWVAV